MALHAKPVISRLPGLMEWVQDGMNGRVIPVRNVEALAEAITDLLRDPATRLAFNATNRALIVEKADHRKLMDEVECLYRELAASRAAG